MQIKDLLKEFNIEKLQTNLIITKVQFFVEKDLLLFFLLSKDNITQEEEEILLDYLNEKFLHLETNIRLRFISIEDYLKAFIIQLKKELASCQSYSKDDLVYLDDKLEIKVYDKVIENQIIESKTFSKLNNIFEDLDIKISFNLDEKGDNFLAEDFQKQKEKELEKRIKSVDLKSIEKREKTKSSKVFKYGYHRGKINEITSFENLVEGPSTIRVKGQVFNIRKFETKGKSIIYNFDLDDGKEAIECKIFVSKDDENSFEEGFYESAALELVGVYQMDDWENTLQFRVFSLEESYIEKRIDKANNKRVELHLHSKFSNLEGLVDLNDLMETLSLWGHESVAITDTNSVQSFPEAYEASKKHNIKLILGMDSKILDEDIGIIKNIYKEPLGSLGLKDVEYTVFDIETTGLSRYTDGITEIGAVKVKNGEIIDVYQELINPEKHISEKIIELTGITNEMVSDKPTVDKVLPDFIKFAENSILVAHNADFDIGFIEYKSKKIGLEFKPVYIDTMWMARALNPDMRNHRLNTMAKKYSVRLLNHHRASDDAKATAEIFIKMMDEIYAMGIKNLDELNRVSTDYPKSKYAWYYNPIYVKDNKGLKNLYKIVSKSNMDYLSNEPGIPFSEIYKLREGLFISSGSYKSRLFEYIAMGYDYNIILDEASKFDFLQVEPLSFWEYLVDNFYIENKEHLFKIHDCLIKLGEDLNIPVVATGNVYYIEESDYVYKNILMNYPRKRSTDKKGYFNLKTTEEMMDEFIHLGEDIARKVVIDNPLQITKSIDRINPIAEGTYTPKQAGSDEKLRKTTYEKAYSIYGNPLPTIVEERLERELNSIISNGYSVLYTISQELVKKSNDDGYLVGSRGSVGSSFAATMADITEVNPLEPHYICRQCKNSEFITDKSVGSGIDLPDKTCPNCGSEYNKDGHDIPFEVFLGFEGDKEPDIDLNFAGEYQSTIHKYTEDVFGSDKVFRAGTIGTIADKTAYGMARKYKEFYPLDDSLTLTNANIRRVQRKIVGVKRTTGQHAGGLIIVPDDKEIEDFTPIQYPANDSSSGIKTTHFDYHSIEENLLKLDLLGHNVPSIIRMLSDQTGVNSLEIPMDDKDTMSIFTSTDSLGIKNDYSNKDSGTLGIPEFGTHFVRGMLKDTEPKSFSDLVRISGLSHGTDVWLNNAQDLINSGICELKDTICTRDDIMNYLISKDMDKKKSFDIMERVRKGRGVPEDSIKLMKEKKIPQWYINSCNTIKYMFPKAHAVAYVMMSYRIAYFKVHYPEYFYATYFTTKLSDYNHEYFRNGLEYLQNQMAILKNSDNYSKDINKYYVMEVGEEMYSRGIDMLNVDLYKSHPFQFTVMDEGKVLPPLIALENISQQIAKSISIERKKGKFISKEEFQKRTGATKTAMESLNGNNVFGDLQDTNQLDFFAF